MLKLIDEVKKSFAMPIITRNVFYFRFVASAVFLAGIASGVRRIVWTF